MYRQKRVLAIHDISCIGRCSLTVALPILSAMGAETACLPTAVLSTHTGGFSGFTYRDLTEDIQPIINHWKTLNQHFDAVYTGFLGSFLQLSLVEKIFEDFKTSDNLIIVDPVMADNGQMYKIFDRNFAKGMAKLCSHADVIVPNITEACFLIDEPYVEGVYTKEYIEGLLQKLCKLGAKSVVLTGVYFQEDKLGAACYDGVTGKTDYYFVEKVEGYFHGTGDVFASALTGSLLLGFSLSKSMKTAVKYTVACIKRTKAASTDIRYGVHFEQEIPLLLKLIGK